MPADDNQSRPRIALEALGYTVESDKQAGQKITRPILFGEDGRPQISHDVVSAVMAYLRADGWRIESTALATQHGDDIVATRGAERLVVEAKGEGSSKAHTAKFGQAFNKGQASTHIAVAVLRSLRVASEGTATPAIALPSVHSHRHEVDRVAPALSKAGIWVFWVAQDGGVSVQN